MEQFFFVASIIVSAVLTAIIVIQARTTGLQNRDSGSIYRTRRGVEKTLFQATVVLAAFFLIFSLVISLPIY